MTDNKAFIARGVLVVPTLEEANRLYGKVVPAEISEGNAYVDSAQFSDIDHRISKVAVHTHKGELLVGYLLKTDADKLFWKL